MAKSQQKGPGLDRFGTGKAYFGAVMEKIREHEVDGVKGGSTAGLALLALWMFCDAKGEVMMSVNRLAALLAVKWETANRAVAILRSLRLIAPATRKDGTEIAHKWALTHEEKED